MLGAWSGFTLVGGVSETPGVPVAAGALAAQRFFGNSGVETYDVSGDFTGDGISFSLVSPPSGVTINASTGVISVDTDAIAAVAGFYRTPITVRGANVAGSDDSVFNLSVCTVHFVTLSGVNTATMNVDMSAYPPTNRRTWVLNYTGTGFERTLTIDGTSAASLATQTQLTAEISRIYTSDTSDVTVNLVWSGALSNGLTVAMVTYGYAATLTDTAYAQDSGNDADQSVLTDINVPAGGCVMGFSRGWETFTVPASGIELATGNNFCVAGACIVEAGDATFDLRVDTDTNTSNKAFAAFSVAPLAA